MAEEFGGGVCGGNWWNPSRSIGSSSPRSGINHCDSLIRNWELMSYEAEMMKLRSCKEIAANPSRVSATALFATSPSSIWNHVSLGSVEECFLQETMDTCHFQDPGIGEEDDSSMKGFKQINQELSDVDQSGTGSFISTIAASCRGLPTSSCTTFPIASDHSSLMESLLGLPVVNGQSTPPLKPSPLPFNHVTPYWNPSGNTPINDDVGDSFFASSPSTNNFTAKRSNGDTEASSEPVYKRPRIETPSSLPTFKVRKEKLGDRVTALQQLVSPFGKTDTASVLHEAVEYIKFLHDQVNGLVISHMKNGASIPQQQGGHDGLRSQGLCLVPISKTYAVANDIRADSQFWAVPFGGTFG